jgi:hypothetical protein
MINSSFDWVPRTEAVTILGKPVQVDYVDERKFAAASAAVSQTGLDILKLVFRQSYASGEVQGWDRFGTTRSNTNRVVPSVRHWGLDHWASRIGQGSYVNWVIGNSILPDVDPDPSHEGIQKIDRTTVPELTQLPAIYKEIQLVVDNAEAGITPLGLARDSIAFDINPNQVTGASPKGHFEQLYERTVGTLGNAALAYEEARSMTTSIRTEEDSLEVLRAAIVDSERAVTSQLIDIYGTPYSDDMGPGKTYSQEYRGPDLVHYLYDERPEYIWPDDITDVSRLALKTNYNIKIFVSPEQWNPNNIVEEKYYPFVLNQEVNINFNAYGVPTKPSGRPDAEAPTLGGAPSSGRPSAS